MMAIEPKAVTGSLVSVCASEKPKPRSDSQSAPHIAKAAMGATNNPAFVPRLPRAVWTSATTLAATTPMTMNQVRKVTKPRRFDDQKTSLRSAMNPPGVSGDLIPWKDGSHVEHA